MFKQLQIERKLSPHRSAPAQWPIFGSRLYNSNQLRCVFPCVDWRPISTDSCHNIDTERTSNRLGLDTCMHELCYRQSSQILNRRIGSAANRLCESPSSVAFVSSRTNVLWFHWTCRTFLHTARKRRPTAPNADSNAVPWKRVIRDIFHKDLKRSLQFILKSLKRLSILTALISLLLLLPPSSDFDFSIWINKIRAVRCFSLFSNLLQSLHYWWNVFLILMLVLNVLLHIARIHELLSTVMTVGRLVKMIAVVMLFCKFFWSLGKFVLPESMSVEFFLANTTDEVLGIFAL